MLTTSTSSRSARRAGFVSTWLALGFTLTATASGRAQDSVLYSQATYLNERCLPPCRCALGPLDGRLYGTYTLRLVNIGDVFDFYAIDDAEFFVRTATGTVSYTGSGTFRYSEIANLQNMDLTLTNTSNTGVVQLTSDVVPIQVPLPAVRIELSNSSLPCQNFEVLFVGGPTPACPIDLDNGGGLGIADNSVDVSDLLYFLEQFEAGHLAADFVGGPCDCVDCVCPDDAVDIVDLLFFLRRFEAGC